MKPYFQDSLVTIYHADCRELISEITADLVLTDPPYGVQGGRGKGNQSRMKAVYAASWPDTPEYIRAVCVPVIAGGECVKRFSRVILTPGIPSLRLYPVPNDVGCFWTPASLGYGEWGINVFNPILYYGRDPRRGGPWPTGKQVTEAPGVVGHPNPKPLNAWKWLLSKGSVETSDIIFDPFMGSGTTLRAAKDLGRRAVGIEIEERYCELAAGRMAQEVLAL